MSQDAGTETQSTDQPGQGQNGEQTKQQPETGGSDDKGRGGKEQVLADLASERDKRQAFERELNGFKENDAAFKSGLAKLLGLQEDEVKPEELQRQLSEVQTKQAASDRELAVFRLAGRHGANPELLTDSTRFMQSIAEIAPGDTEKIAAAIKDAVEKNTSYRAVAPGRGAGDAGAGTGGGKNLSMDDLMRGAR
jgi:hypothetical protein